MPDLKANENQKELFGEFEKSPKKSERFQSLPKTNKPILLSTNLEQLVIIGIVSILVLCFIFFLGVLRGKQISELNLSKRAQPVAVKQARLVSQVSQGAIPLSGPYPKTASQGRGGVETMAQVSRSAETFSQAAKPSVRVFSTSESKAPGIPQRAAQPPLELDSSKPYTIQLVTHKKKEIAENEVRSLRRAGLLSWIIPSGDYYQVCVGQYQTKDEAKKDLRYFTSRHKDCFLRRK